MDSKLIAEARKGLRPVDVYMRGCNVTVSNSFEHRGHEHDYDQQYRNNVEQIAVLEPASETDPDEVSTFVRVQFQFGFRWGTKFSTKADEEVVDDASDSEPEDREFEEMGRIEGTFVSEYSMEKPVSFEAIQEFALHHACYQAWPFWREFVVSMCSRLNVQKPSIPLIHLPHNRESNNFTLERSEEVVLRAKKSKRSARKIKK